MREIKFKAWLKNRKVMGKVLEIHFGKEITVYAMKDGLGKTWFEEENENVVIMQCTGLKDKNGKEIYEGDVLLEKNCNIWEEYTKDDGSKWSRMTNKTEDRLYKVYYDEKTCQFTTNRGRLWTLINLTEVIGNIWEHPELIKGV